jgi:hypothetical protein
MKTEKVIMGALKAYAGFLLFWISGGSLLILLGLVPVSALVSTVGLFMGGIISAGVLSLLSTLGIIWLLAGVPTAVIGIKLFDNGVREALGRNLNVSAVVKNGTKKIPVLKQLVGIGEKV